MIGKVAAVLAALYSLAALAAGSEFGPYRVEGLEEWTEALARGLDRHRFFVFPLGVATSLSLLLGLLGHSNLRSARGVLQAVALAAVLAGGLLWAGLGQPVASSALAAAHRGAGHELAELAASWRTFRLASTALALVVATTAVLAELCPAASPRTGPLALLEPRHRSLLALLGAATLFEGYDRFIASLALPYIGDDLGAGETTLGLALSLVRSGALGAILLGRLADRYGRRRLLLVTILGYTLATAATAGSRGILDFAAFQFVATAFLVAELSLAQVVVAEEFAPTLRARGQGFLGAFAALGAGLAALLFPLFQRTSWGWRGLYAVGIVPLLWIAWLRRALPETARWQAARAEGSTERLGFEALLDRRLRARFFVLCGVAFGATAAWGPAFAFASYRATKAYAWEPFRISTMILVGGGLGFFGWFVWGALAERFGRRAVGLVGISGSCLAAFVFYRTSWLFPAFASLVFLEAGAQIALSALGTELFPTPLRGLAKSRSYANTVS
jgi:putative MFS transporter